MGVHSIPYWQRTDRQLPNKLSVPKIARRLFPGITFGVNRDGYWVARTGKYRNKYLHRLVAGVILNRLGLKLEPTTVVHHIGGNRLNSRPQALAVMDVSEHDLLAPRCPYTGKFQRTISGTGTDTNKVLNLVDLYGRYQGRARRLRDCQQDGTIEQIGICVEEVPF